MALPTPRRRRPRRSAALVATCVVAGLVGLPGGASAQLPGSIPQGIDGLHVIPSDLDFILKQIQISEAHARAEVTNDAGYSLLCADPADQTGKCVPHPQLPWGVRTVDGSSNNLLEGREHFGSADQAFPRLLPVELRDGEAAPPFAPQVPGATNVCATLPSAPATCYEQTAGMVYDSEPREISNLIVDLTETNPAAVAAAGESPITFDIPARPAIECPPPSPTGPPCTSKPETPAKKGFFIPNEAPDEGLSAPFNTFFTFFGQFFDHGLDLVNKGGSGTVVVPLNPDDELYDPTSRTNFLVLSRVTNTATPGPDGVLGTGDDVPVRDHVNQTTPFVDQNQTYTSHPSHQVFLREYAAGPDGPVDTGHLLDGPGGGLASWADVKAQARSVLGIDLSDRDVLDVPLLATDPYGNFVPGPDGLPQLATTGGLVQGDTGAPVSPRQAGALRTGHAFLDDIAHNASPAVCVGSSGADLCSVEQPPGPNGEVVQPKSYDAALLGEHFITGDGRGNENIGLTAVHHVFHSEHNRLVGQITDLLEAPGNEWLDQAYRSNGELDDWSYGQRIFQAARYVTEMQYQHGVFEEFARRVQPLIDVVPFNESSYHTDINAATTAEFAHVVYRFGHSMLTETVPRRGGQVDLLTAFLNPRLYDADGTMSAEEAAGSILEAMVQEPGSGIDEFVTDTLRNSLLGLPLDLPAINIMRARDAGVPPLQVARERFFAVTGNSDLAPYTSWEDFRLAMKHRDSITNFVAAYGIHPTLEDPASGPPMTVDERRAAASALVADGGFMNAPAASTGVNDIDFWMGGLAEAGIPFGGMLGTTFNHVFETQLEDLQNGDRFYYLSRNIGLNLFHQLEGNAFSAMIARNTDASLLPADVFSTPDLTIDLDGIGTSLPAGLTLVDGQYRFDGGEHVNIHGTAGDDRFRGGIGDDHLVGYAGDDEIVGGAGANSMVGGFGDDYLDGQSGDDNIKGGPGHDTIVGGMGEDLLLAGPGKDLVMHTGDPTQSFGGTGDDVVVGGPAHDINAGNEGDDWLEGGGGADLVQGDNMNGFQNDPNGGHDVLTGGPGNDDLDTEGGDDIMIVSPGSDRHEGMLGFDWATHQDLSERAVADMDNTAFQPPSVRNLSARYDLVEGLSGWDRDDVLRGVGRSDENDGAGHELTQAQLDRVEGLRELLSSGGTDAADLAAPFLLANTTNNILLGGGGNDLLEGRGGDDYLDGSAWLRVSLTHDGRDFRSLAALVEAAGGVRGVDPGAISIRREVVRDGDAAEAVNTAQFSGNEQEYDIQLDTPAVGLTTVVHDDPQAGEDDGTDVLRNVQALAFDDVVLSGPGFENRQSVNGTVVIADSPEEGNLTTATVTLVPGVDAASVLHSWQQDDGTGWATFATTPTPEVVPGDPQVGSRLRLVVSFTLDGRPMQVVSDPTDPVDNVNDAPESLTIDNGSPAVGDVLQASGPVDADGTTGVAITWTWLADGTPVPGADGPSFTVTAAQLGAAMSVRAEYVDAHGTAESITSAPTLPVATAPTAGGGGTGGGGTGGGGTGGGGTGGGGTGGGTPPPTDPVTPDPTDPVADERVTVLSGATRVDTALAVSQDLFAAAGTTPSASLRSAQAVVLSRADGFADGLAGTPLAASLGGPVLLTSTGSLDDRVLAEVERILPAGGTVHLLGGTAALSDDVEDAVTAAGFRVVRHAGADRFATSVQIAGALGDPTTLLLATGTDFADALSAGAAASRLGGAVLLTDGGRAPASVTDYLRGRQATTYAVGGPAATAFPSAEPVAGTTRYGTAQEVARAFFSGHAAVGIASGLAFPDALAGGLHASLHGAPLLLSGQGGLSVEAAQHLRDNASVQRVFLYGGAAALAPQVGLDAAGALR